MIEKSDRERLLEAALEEIAGSAMSQLDNTGKGKEPSPRLAAAILKANDLLGFDIAEKHGRSAAMQASIKELGSE